MTVKNLLKSWRSEKLWSIIEPHVDSDKVNYGRMLFSRNACSYTFDLEGNVIGVCYDIYFKNTIEVRFKKYNKKEDEIRDLLENSPADLSSLIKKEMPLQYAEKLNNLGVNLFDEDLSAVKIKCSCKDKFICSHIICVWLFLCKMVDENPEISLLLRGIDIRDIIDVEDVIESFNYPQIADLIEENNDYPISKNENEPFDYSKIPYLLPRTINLLSRNPKFYNKNFRDQLQKILEKCTECYADGYELVLEEYNISIENDELLAVKQFKKKWTDPSRWEKFSITLNDRFVLMNVDVGKKNIFYESKSKEKNFFLFFTTMPKSLLQNVNPHIKFMSDIFEFSRNLLSKSAIVPEVNFIDNNHGFIRWSPALFDEEVNKCFSQFVSNCPEDLIFWERSKITPYEQVRLVISWVLKQLIFFGKPEPIQKLSGHLIYEALFSGNTVFLHYSSWRNAFFEASTWFSRLSIQGRPYKFMLFIDDVVDYLELKLKITWSHIINPEEISEMISELDELSRFEILSDLHTILDFVPEIRDSVNSNQPVQMSLQDFPKFFVQVLPILKAAGVQIMLPKGMRQMLIPKLRLNLKSKNKIANNRESFMNLDNLLEFDWKVAIGDQEINPEEFKTLLTNSNGIIRLADEYIIFDETQINQFLKHMEKLPEKLSRSDLMHSALSGEFFGADVKYDEQITGVVTKLKSYEPVKLPANLNAELRPYQERGFSWLVQNIELGFGSIIADDMGLGKTIQVLTAILHYKNAGYLNDGKVLIVAPTGLLSNWSKEIQKFTPDLSSHIYHGKNREFDMQFDVFITSYGLARRDIEEINKHKWFLLVIDEAQNIKNTTADQTKAIKTIIAHNKIAMSGTPVENRLLEYWSIFDFTNKHYLGSAKHFQSHYAVPIEKNADKECLERFTKVTAPFIMRRLKSDKSIIKDLPDRIENNRYCSLTPKQAALYEKMVKTTLEKISISVGIERKGLIFKLLNALKQICNHPAQYAKEKIAKIDESGKLVALEEILLEIQESGEKTLIFTQYVEMGEILSRLLEEKFGFVVPFLCGEMSRTARDKLVQTFQNEADPKILLISLKAGGTGLNLTAANHVIHYDLWWNPAVEAQATDRAYRIGQEKNVMVHRLITLGTFEEKINEMIQSKKALANLTVGDGENWITEMTDSQLQDLVNMRQAE